MPNRSELPSAPPLDGTHAEIARSALELLGTNSLGRATRPGPLYPHQWSWDAAAIAMGRGAWDQERAEQELRSLFAGQWSDGMLPHIVFSDSDRYFPGPAFWETERSAAAPAGVPTSGIVQPPIHATAAWRLYQRAANRERATEFLAHMLPRLAAWHDYLYRERTRDGGALVEVWHPWESGMDNSPAWDAALARIELTPDQIPSYARIDITLADPAERPSDFEYDRYVYLVRLMSDNDYDGARIREVIPFAIQPVLFNSLLVQSGRDLAQIARELDEDPAPYEAMADRTAGEIEALWDERQGCYLDYDVRAGAHVALWTCAAFAPLCAGIPGAERAAGMLERLDAARAPLPDGLWGLPSVSPAHPSFDNRLYWRGPIWPIYQWVVAQGVSRYGHEELASHIRESTIELVRRHGFWEHYDPLSGRGQGDPSFSWTAGLVLDMLADAPREAAVEGAPAGAGE